MAREPLVIYSLLDPCIVWLGTAREGLWKGLAGLHVPLAVELLS